MHLNVADLNKAMLQEIQLPGLPNYKNIFLLRLDLIHPTVHGNKWFKLKYNLIEAKEKDYDTILTFGGAYSNHIHATAAAGKLFGFKTIGIIRGEKRLPLNPTLEFAFQRGMKFHYVSRSEYRHKHTEKFIDNLKSIFGEVYIIPEGGTNLLAVKGCAEIPRLINSDYDCLAVACGTAGTLSGLVCGSNNEAKALGFSVLKGGSFLIDQADKLIKKYSGKESGNWEVNLDYHFGGYAKINKSLIDFIFEFKRLNNIMLDPLYTGKMMYGIFDLSSRGYFKQSEKIIVLHTGGLQGLEGMKNKIANLDSL